MIRTQLSYYYSMNTLSIWWINAVNLNQIHSYSISPVSQIHYFLFVWAVEKSTIHTHKKKKMNLAYETTIVSSTNTTQSPSF